MTPRTLALLLAAGGLAFSACGGGSGNSSTATATATSTAASGTAKPVSGANATAVVKRADAFLDTLSSSQRDAVVFDFTDSAKTASWSNLPAALAPRKGIALGDMSDAQQQAALALMKVALSDQGYEELAEVREADDYLAKQAASGGGGGPGGPEDYGSGNYFLAFYGTPSTSDEWMLQYTGHHLTYNIAYKGGEVSFGPAFEGVEPITFAEGGKTIAPLSDEAAGFGDTLAALTGAQRADAKLDQAYDDLLLGAGKDGPFPTDPEGVLVSDLSQQAQDAVTKTIRAYVGDLGGAAADRLVKSYVDAYDETRFAWAGDSTDTEDLGFYARLDGPKVWIELSTQHGIVMSGNHYHSIYREQGSDYGE